MLCNAKVLPKLLMLPLVPVTELDFPKAISKATELTHSYIRLVTFIGNSKQSFLEYFVSFYFNLCNSFLL